MPLITDKNQVLEIYKEAGKQKRVLPTFNAENVTSIEAILSAVHQYGVDTGQADLPIIIGITNTYPHRPQAVFYTHTRQWEVGLGLFLNDLRVLTSGDSPYAKLRVMVHLDHIQWNETELLEWDMGQFSSIMYDASTLPLEENLRKTRDFVEKNNSKIVIEGACDEIVDASGGEEIGLTTPETAERYYRETGVDIIVPNLGTEHRASASELRYHSKLARDISAKTGPRLCLHGTSSVDADAIGHLYEDGICKVNIWTALERDSAPVLLQNMVRNAAKICGKINAREMVKEGLLGEKADTESETFIDYFTSAYRHSVVFEEMQNIVYGYLQLFYA